jgi:ADP-heptose:LPS heptosyltransferase/glycosyltransferase involved in cell wall biosynthesis
MKLLIVTQVVDRNDQVLGFFHSWIEELSKHVKGVTVICLKAGEYSLPPNVRVISLGKEKGSAGKLRYSWRFLRDVWQERKNYDTALVHMNQEYILIAGWLWRMLGKKIFLWRNHYAGSLLTDLAALFCTKIFCTSKFSYTAKFSKTTIMPVGVDTNVFKPTPHMARESRSILFLARMSPSKNPHVLIEALGILHKKSISLRASFVGDPILKDVTYYESLKRRAAELELTEVEFKPGVANRFTPEVYSAHDIFVNCSRSGMYDKTIFEAAAAGCLVVAESADWRNLAGQEFSFDGSAESLAARLESLLTMPEGEKEAAQSRLRELVVERHSLSILGQQLMRVMRERRAVLFQNGSIGDFLMWIYLSEQLVNGGQFSKVIMVVPRNADFLRDFLEQYPYITVVEISPQHPLRVLKLLKSHQSVVIHPTIGRIPLRLKLLAWFVAQGVGSELAGFKDSGPLCWLYNKLFTYDTTKPYIDTVRELARVMGGHSDTEPPLLHVATATDVLAKYNLQDKKYIVFNPGASNPRRTFTLEAATEFVRSISEKHPDVQIVLCGSKKEAPFIGEIIQKANTKNAFQAVGLPAKDIATLIRHAHLFVGTDSGMTHLAAFLGTKVLEVAHDATANWLAWYVPQATVLYRLKGEDIARTDKKYVEEHGQGQLRPFTDVAVSSISEAFERLL